jgi:hypothetical protein
MAASFAIDRDADSPVNSKNDGADEPEQPVATVLRET